MTELANEKVTLSVEEGEGCAVTFQVRVKPAACEAAYQKALREARKGLSIPGFRKGKVPEAVVAKHFGDRLNSRCIDILVQDVFNECINLYGGFPWNNETIEAPKLEEFSRDAELDLTYRFERTPKMPEINRDNLDLPEIPIEEVTDEALEAHLAQVRKHYATYEDADTVEEDGKITCKVESLENEEPTTLSEAQELDVTPDQMPEWLLKEILGKKLGATVEQTPSDRDHPVRLTINAIQRSVLPDDEALVAAAKVESMDQLRERARGHLQKDAEERRHRARIEVLWNTLFKQYPFDLPASLIEEEKRSRVKRMVQELREQKLSDEEVAAKEKEIEGAAAAEAQRAIRSLFLSRAIVDRANLNPSEADVMARTRNMLTWQAMMAGKQAPNLDEASLRPYYDHVRLQLIKELAEDYLLERVAA